MCTSQCVYTTSFFFMVFSLYNFERDFRFVVDVKKYAFNLRAETTFSVTKCIPCSTNVFYHFTRSCVILPAVDVIVCFFAKVQLIDYRECVRIT